MKKNFLISACLFFCLIMFTGCDPVLPAKNIDATYTPNPLIQGDSAEIEIIYPDIEGTAVVKWTDQNVEVTNGDDIIEISGLTITGLKPGTALLKIEVKANCAFMGVIVDKQTLSTEIEIEVAEK